MKQVVYKYKYSKFKCFLNGLVFAVISTIALLLCLSDLSKAADSKVILPFFIAIVSMLMGIVSMFYSGGLSKEKIQQ
ncbi:hypothetical protein HNQ56_002437 [Anaerotaenia torta]|uniref:hypothetical protein n=1 Tax=Anaerotaenia torta TaxID=433293 RepID=UPI003D1D4807